MNNPMLQYTLRTNQLKSSSVEKDLHVLASTTSLNTNQEGILAAKKASSILGYIGQCVASRSKGVIHPLCSALVRHIWSAGSSVGLPSIRETGMY